VRSALARSVREALGNKANAATGALGISSRIWAIAGRTRRIATNIPPALTFRAVANSRNSLPFPSGLRTNTGIANGNLAHFRRSFRPLAPFMQTSPSLWTLAREHLRGQISGKYRRKPGKLTNFPPSSTAKSTKERLFSALLFAFCLVPQNPATQVCNLQKCKLLLHLGNSPAFSVDNNLRLSYDFLTGTRPEMACAIPLSPCKPVVFS
jgi:hypothetical protein